MLTKQIIDQLNEKTLRKMLPGMRQAQIDGIEESGNFQAWLSIMIPYVTNKLESIR